ncbi:MAG TPA: hypothetical protein PK523_05245 [Elusimicrobiales bacterium]|nr:hypothetical protein [Elusimicrobiales bacterium]
MTKIRFFFVLLFSLPAWAVVAALFPGLSGDAVAETGLFVGLFAFPALLGLGIDLVLLYKARSARPPAGRPLFFGLGAAATVLPVVFYFVYLALMHYSRG